MLYWAFLTQIDQVVNNCETLFCLDDVIQKVEIWEMCHAKKILDVLGQVFDDVTSSGMDMVCDTGNTSDCEIDDDVLLGEWVALTEDEELINLMTENLSLSGMESTIPDSTKQSLECSDVSPVAVASLNNVNIA